MDIRTRWIILGALLALLGGGYALSGQITTAVNDATRANLSKQVSNLPCGPTVSESGQRHAECPGTLKCYQGPIDPNGPSFDSQRVGVTINGPRCVTPVYVEHYCGIWEGAPESDVYPSHIGPCIDRSLSPIGYITALLNEDNLYGRITNPDQNGAELIRSHGLKLAIEDPDAEDINRSAYE